MRQPVRRRLTVLYSGLFVAAAAVLVALLYLLVEGAPEPPEPGTSLPVPPTAPTAGRWLPAALTALGVMAVASIGLGWWVSGRVLRPVSAITGAVRRINAERLDRRLAHTGPDDELKALADTFDALLDRLETAFTAQRGFVANASHELRTPLTLQRTLIEVALADPGADAAALRATLARALEVGREQERLIEAMLTLARAHQGVIGREPVDLAALAGGTGASAPVDGDPVLLDRMIGNLVDNAVRYNVPGGWVRVTTGSGDGRSWVRVENSGPPVTAGQAARLTEPFRRLDPARRAGGDGHGLGLSIVAAIVDSHGGTLTLVPRQEGGLDVTAAFRSAAETRLPGPQDGLGTVGDLEFREDVGDVVADRLR